MPKRYKLLSLILTTANLACFGAATSQDSASDAAASQDKTTVKDQNAHGGSAYAILKFARTKFFVRRLKDCWTQARI